MGVPVQTISPNLFRAMESQEEKRFIRKLARVVREAVPDLAGEPEPDFTAQIRLLVEEARSYGLRAEQTIGAYAITAGLLGLNFVDEHPAAKEILTGHETEFKKADLLEAFTIKLLETLEQ